MDNLKERDSLESLRHGWADDIETDLKRNRMEGHALNSGLGYRQGMGLFVHGTEPFVV